MATETKWREARHDGIDCWDCRCEVHSKSGSWTPRVMGLKGTPFNPECNYRIPDTPDEETSQRQMEDEKTIANLENRIKGLVECSERQASTIGELQRARSPTCRDSPGPVLTWPSKDCYPATAPEPAPPITLVITHDEDANECLYVDGFNANTEGNTVNAIEIADAAKSTTVTIEHRLVAEQEWPESLEDVKAVVEPEPVNRVARTGTLWSRSIEDRPYHQLTTDLDISTDETIAVREVLPTDIDQDVVAAVAAEIQEIVSVGRYSPHLEGPLTALADKLTAKVAS